MAFYGYSFTYNGVSCDEYNLMLYDVGGEGQDNGQFITREPVEERLARNYQPLYYGSIFNKLLPRAKNESRKKQRAGKRSKRKEHTKERPKWPLFCAAGNTPFFSFYLGVYFTTLFEILHLFSFVCFLIFRSVFPWLLLSFCAGGNTSRWNFGWCLG